MKTDVGGFPFTETAPVPDRLHTLTLIKFGVKKTLFFNILAASGRRKLRRDCFMLPCSEDSNIERQGRSKKDKEGKKKQKGLFALFCPLCPFCFPFRILQLAPR